MENKERIQRAIYHLTNYATGLWARYEREDNVKNGNIPKEVS